MSEYKPREWDWIVNTDVLLQGTIKDWPANIQDGIYEHLAKMSKEKDERLYIERSRTAVDPETGPFIHLRIKNMPPWTELKTTGLPQ